MPHVFQLFAFISEMPLIAEHIDKAGAWIRVQVSILCIQALAVCTCTVIRSAGCSQRSCCQVLVMCSTLQLDIEMPLYKLYSTCATKLQSTPHSCVYDR
jgi:hypothetical protein